MELKKASYSSPRLSKWYDHFQNKIYNFLNFYTKGLIRFDAHTDKFQVPENVKARLSESIKDLQLEYGQGTGNPIETNELTHALLTAIEAIFIHGLKGQPSRAVKASSSHRNLPEPSFWTFVLVFSHKETINSIEKLRSINTDIGRGRAWIRMALNDGLLCSYLSAMAGDKATLRRHYQRHAMLRDSDIIDVFVRFVSQF